MGSGIIMENFSKNAGEKGVPESIVQQTRSEVIELMKQQLKPEFLNRIDEIVMFTPLTKHDTLEIVDIQLRVIERMLKENGIELKVERSARQWLADKGFDPMFGARPIKRTIQRYVVNELSKEILAGNIDRTRPIIISAEEDRIVFNN